MDVVGFAIKAKLVNMLSGLSHFLSVHEERERARRARRSEFHCCQRLRNGLLSLGTIMTRCQKKSEYRAIADVENRHFNKCGYGRF